MRTRLLQQETRRGERDHVTEVEETGVVTEREAASVRTSSLAPACFGFALGVGYANIAGVVDSSSFKQTYHDPDDWVLELLAGIMQLGCVLGSIAVGVWGDKFGRVRIMRYATIVLLTGTALCGVPVFTHIPIALLFVGRFFIGLSGGLLCAIVPIYVSEISPAKHRGAIESLFQLAVETGILVGYVVNYLAIPKSPHGWTFSLLAQFIATAAFCAPLFIRDGTLPVSHRWRRLRQDATKRDDDALSTVSMWNQDDRRSVLVALFTCTLQVGTAIDIMTVYAPSIFDHVLNSSDKDNDDDEDDESRKLLYTIFVGLTFCLVTPVTCCYVDSLGRRPLLLAGSGGMTVSLLLLALSERFGWGAFSIIFALAFVFAFSFSWGPIAWMYVVIFVILSVLNMSTHTRIRDHKQQHSERNCALKYSCACHFMRNCVELDHGLDRCDVVPDIAKLARRQRRLFAVCRRQPSLVRICVHVRTRNERNGVRLS